MFPEATSHYIDLLDSDQYNSFLSSPAAFKQALAALPAGKEWVIVDEVQRLPEILNTVHQSLESNAGIRFALTGSSARKLKRGGANMLAGRAFVYHMFPLTQRELGARFSQPDALEWGGLPRAALEPSTEQRALYLRSYAESYLREEIFQEQLVRGLEPFRRFLRIAASTNGQILNYSKIADDCGSTTPTVQSYYQILEDTLIGFFIPAFHRSIRKRQRTNPKFYLFDTGVQRALSGTLAVPLLPGSWGYGNAFEHFVIVEIARLQTYLRKDYELSYLRTKDDAEIDLIVERPGEKIALIEIKSTERVTERDIAALQRLTKDFSGSQSFVFSRDPVAKKIGTIEALPWQEGLRALGL